MCVCQDWIEFEEIADLEERAKSHFFEKENEEEVQKNQAAEKEKEFQSVKATKDQVGEVSRHNAPSQTRVGPSSDRRVHVFVLCSAVV